MNNLTLNPDAPATGTRKVTSEDAHFVLSMLNNVLARVSERGTLARHIEWTKEAVWAAAYPGGHDDSLLNGLEAAADQVG
jgi:hypothetical protein